MRILIVALVAIVAASPILAQDQRAVYMTEPQGRFQFDIDGVVRSEWTDEIPFQETSRRLIRLRPAVTAKWSALELGVGGDFVYGNDENDELPEESGGGLPPIIRDNYRSKDARLDLAFARLEPASWLRLEAGRFPMPVGVTEMIWDRDLRVQGGAVTLTTRDRGPFRRLELTGLGLRGGHVFEDEDTPFEDEDTEMLMVAGTAAMGEPGSLQGEVTAAYMTWNNLDDLVPQVRRQNTRVGGLIANDFDVVDAVVRLRKDGAIPWQLVAEGCVNTAVDDDNKGLWLAVVLGSTVQSRARAEYTFAFVDPDATVAAYGADDFLWVTGWEGHRLDLGMRTGDHSTLHAVGIVARFKDGPEAVRNEWEKRLRVEMRIR